MQLTRCGARCRGGGGYSRAAFVGLNERARSGKAAWIGSPAERLKAVGRWRQGQRELPAPRATQRGVGGARRIPGNRGGPIESGGSRGRQDMPARYMKRVSGGRARFNFEFFRGWSTWSAAVRRFGRMVKCEPVRHC